jgi:phospholipid transport system substrate-binding protein
MKSKLGYWLSAIGLFMFCHSSMAQDAVSGIAVVEKLHTSLINVMRESDSLGYAGRVDALQPTLESTFDFHTIARIVTGKYWKSIESSQSECFIEVFKALSVATYASNFSGYAGESFETISAETKRGNLLVKSAIVKADGDRISLDYVLRKNDEVWQIVNVIASGVSDLSLKRADYTAVIKSEGFDSLIGKLTDKVANYASSGH